jgi:tRNA-specific 2-thiouridylase
MKPISQTHVIVGLSGGVDSSVAALSLQQQGYQVEGLFMQNWAEDGKDNFCPADIDLKDARAVCLRLNIPLHTVSFAKEYWDRVFQYFLAEYAKGRTPNPDILCNKEIKFKAFLNDALARGADYIATGHYVRTRIENGQYQLLKAHDLNKDQSYFLYTLQQDQLARSLFPLGELTKPEVRKVAQQASFENHGKKDSTGICFIGERRFSDFLGEYLLARPGDIETEDGRKIGRHQGLMFYTLGQRQGLGIGGVKDFDDAPWYVIQKDIPRQVLVVAQAHDHPQLLSRSLSCQQLHWVAGSPPQTPFHCSAKTRYRQADAACYLAKIAEDHYEVVFAEPQWAVTPGQSVVFYSGAVCLGGGVISAASRNIP